jgi:hypothetical protein
MDRNPFRDLSFRNKVGIYREGNGLVTGDRIDVACLDLSVGVFLEISEIRFPKKLTLTKHTLGIELEEEGIPDKVINRILDRFN